MANITSFSLSHAGILDGVTAATELADIFGVNEGTLEISSDTYERTGDDTVLSTQRWVTKGTLSLRTNYIPQAVLTLLYNTPVVSGATGTTQQLWAEKSMNIKPYPVVVTAPGQDADGEPFEMSFVLYKVQFGQIAFDQFMSYKEGLAVSLEGDVLLSDKDELGAPFSDNLGRRIGKIVTLKPVVTP